MEPQPIHKSLLSDRIIPEENKKLCKDICIVSGCLTGVCIIYCIIFLGVMNEELDMNMTYF